MSPNPVCVQYVGIDNANAVPLYPTLKSLFNTLIKKGLSGSGSGSGSGASGSGSDSGSGSGCDSDSGSGSDEG